MRKTSQDGGDNTSITSGKESEIKKPGAGILKSTRNSIKRKVQSFSNESDDTAEPLLHKSKEKTEIEKQSAKLLISKPKTDLANEKGDDRDKLLADDKITEPSISDIMGITRSAPISNGLKEQKASSSKPIVAISIHNHMNTNVFKDQERALNSITTNTQTLVELDVSISSGPRYSPSPLIFTTAKIHTDGKKQQMEPVQVTPVPILSTVEGGVVKIETTLKDIVRKEIKYSDIVDVADKISITIKDEKVTSPLTQAALLFKVSNKHNFIATTNQNIVVISSNESLQSTNSLALCKNESIDTLSKVGSVTTYSSITVAKTPSNTKNVKTDISNGKNQQVLPECKADIEHKLTDCIHTKELTKSSKYVSNSSQADKTEKDTCADIASSFAKNYEDINRNIHPSSSSRPIDNISNTEQKDTAKTNHSPISITKDDRGNHISTTTVKPLIKEQTSSKISNEELVKETTVSNNIDNATNLLKTSSPPISFQNADVSTINKTSLPNVNMKPLSNVTNIISTTPISINSTTIITSTKGVSLQTSFSTKTESTAYKTKDDKKKIETHDSKYPLDLGKPIGSAKIDFIHDSSLPEASIKVTCDTTSKSPLTEKLNIKISTTATPNNVATVVSSITKPTPIAKTSASSSKLASHTSTGSMKKISSSKQGATLSTVKTVFSGITSADPAVKSSTISAVSPSKPNAKSQSSNKAVELGVKESKSTNVSTPCNTKPTISSSLVKTLEKNTTDSISKPSETAKDTKGSKYDKSKIMK